MDNSTQNSLNETQLLLLDNLIHLEGVADQGEITVREVIGRLTKNNYAGLMKSQNPKKIGTDEEWPCYMSKQRWIDIIDAIKNDPKLLALRISEGKTEERLVEDKNGEVHDLGGMRVACFTDEITDKTTVVFRGTHGAYEWHDNGIGGTDKITGQQQAALNYIENLPERYKDLVVTGHSKGGNKAQFVTIMSDRVEKCYSFDGQGFSIEFLEAYKDRIEKRIGKINSISAEGDYVNCLLNSIAPNKYYVDTDEQSNFLHNHCPDIMLKITRDENGNAIASMRNYDSVEQGTIPKFLNKFTVHINATMDEPWRSIAINGALGFLEGEDAAESDIQKYASIAMLASKLDDFTFNQIKDEYGPMAELLATSVMATVCPSLFFDDLANTLITDFKALAGIAIENIKKLGAFIIDKLVQFGNWVIKVADEIGKAFWKFVDGVKEAWGKVQNFIVGLYNEIVETGKAVAEAIDKFKDRATAAITKFFTNLANGLKKFYSALKNEVVNTWNSAIDKANETVDRIIDKTRYEIKKQNEAFKEGTNYLVNYSKKTMDDLGEKGTVVLKAFGRNVARGMGSYTSARLNVDLLRLADLQNKLRNLERYMGERIHQILKEANKVTSDVGRNYKEYYVQQQIHAINRTCDQIRDSERRVCDSLQRKIKSLQYALEHYKQIESMLCREIEG